MSTPDHSIRAHSEIGASAASRWMACPASVRDSRGAKESTSVYAEEGTALHELVDHCINEGISNVLDCVGQSFNDFIMDEAMCIAAQECVNIAAKYVNDEAYECYVEEKFELKEIHEDMFGSNDFCALGHNSETRKDELVVIDWKFGRGLKVNAKDNIQLVIYALGAYEDYKSSYELDTVKLIISQPRIAGNEYSEWVISVDELLTFKKILKDGVKRVYADNPVYKAGDHCRFCKAKPTCLAIKNMAEDSLTATLDQEPITEEKLPEVAKMTKEQIVKVLDNSGVIKDWLDSVHAHAFRLAESGDKVDGYKLVKKKTNRKVKNTAEFIAEFEETFGDQIFAEKKLTTLGKLEKIVGKKEIAPFLIKPEGANVLAHESDKREEVLPQIDSLLEEADKEDDDYSSMEF